MGWHLLTSSCVSVGNFKMKLDLDVFVISLVRATERRSHVENEFSKIGMEFSYFDGVDGTAEQANLLNKTDQTAWRRFMGAEITPGHLGCYASHVELWRKIGENGKLALVCEDDVTFLPEFPDALKTALQMQNDWDICRFSKIRAKGPICIAQKMGLN